MEKYIDNMSRFLDLQKEMTIALAGRRRPAASPAGSTPGPPWPMVDRTNVLEPGARLRIERDIDLRHDLFLFDHPFGGDVSEIDPRLSPLIVTPLTLNMEMMGSL